MNWLKEKIACFDTETTGTSISESNIASAALVVCQDGEVQEMSSCLIAVEMPEEAGAINGLSTEYLAKNGLSPKNGISAIWMDVMALLDEGIPILGHNVSFDLSLLNSEAKRHGLPPLSSPESRFRPIIDTFVIDKEMDRFRRGKRKLLSLAETYRIDVDGVTVHNSSCDAILSYQVFLAMVKKFPKLDEMDADDLHAAQMVWAKNQAESFRDYRIKQGELLAIAEDMHKTMSGILTDGQMDFAAPGRKTIRSRMSEWALYINKAHDGDYGKEVSIDPRWPIRSL